MKNQKAVFPVTLAVAAISFILFFISVINGWFGPWTGTGDGFCEASHPGLIKQPANTWSNLGFIFAGITIAWQLPIGTFASNKNTLTQSFFIRTFFTCNIVFL